VSGYRQPPQPVWAGIAVQLDDGRIIAIEMIQPEGEIEVSVDDDPTIAFGDFRRANGLGRRTANVRLTGRVAKSWTEWKRTTPQAEIEPAIRAIEAGERRG
jgi:hypothetical protein